MGDFRQYICVKEGTVVGAFGTCDDLSGEELEQMLNLEHPDKIITTTETHGIPIGFSRERYDERWQLIDSETLLREGTIADPRGEWWDEEGSQRTIEDIYKKPGIGWRRDRPKPYEHFRDGKWVVDEQEKLCCEKTEALEEEKGKLWEKESYLRETDWYRLREEDSKALAQQKSDSSLVKPVPLEILEERARMREEISTIRLEISRMQEDMNS